MASLLAAVLALAAASCATASDPHQQHLPDIDAARHNAFALFNSIHSAARQWGSSVHHNGMSFYLAQAPKGSVFYHGGFTATRPSSFEWLAFEVEHAANFAQSWEGQPQPRPDKSRPHSSDAANLGAILLWHRYSRSTLLREAAEAPHLVDQIESTQQQLSSHAREMGHDDGHGTLPGNPPDLGTPFRGYFHTYRANRPLNLVYIDGEGAAKCPLGTMDSQDLVLLGWNHTAHTPREQMLAEFSRARGFCALAGEWALAGGVKIDGFVRMEAGFEIIYCDFSPTGGLDLTSVQASPFRNESHLDQDSKFSFQSPRLFEWFRAAAARFRGLPTSRLDVDWSSMVSAFAYPVNLSNPDVTRQDLPRLLNSTADERSSIRSRLEEVVIERAGSRAGKKHTIDWQGVVDNIVTRYSHRLALITHQNLTANDFLVVISTLIDPFVDYLDHSPTAERSAASRCTRHHLQSLSLNARAWTPEDHVISAATETVSGTICALLFTTRRLLIDSLATGDVQSALEQARDIAWGLVHKLKWSTWKECGGCRVDEICSIPMFPVGNLYDYFHPTCKNVSQIDTGYFGRWS